MLDVDRPEPVHFDSLMQRHLDTVATWTLIHLTIVAIVAIVAVAVIAVAVMMIILMMTMMMMIVAIAVPMN